MYNDLIGAYKKGQELNKIFVEERLKPVQIHTCKQGNKGGTIKYKDKFATLKEENLFISRIAMIRGTRDIDMKAIIGKYELTPVVHSLMQRDGTLLDGWEGKSDLAKTVLKKLVSLWLNTFILKVKLLQWMQCS